MTTAILLLAFALQSGLPEVELKDDLVITESSVIKPGVYRIQDGGEPGVLRVKGEHVLVIMHGVNLIGSDEGQTPDTFAGTGIVLEGKGNIIHGGKIRGFKVGVRVDGGEDHWLMNMNVGRNFAQRLLSTPEKENEADWIRPHVNDKGEWAEKYGAGIWVKGAKKVRILGCEGRGSQNGILLDRSTECVVRDCDFSYNSGWGIALWRSSANEVAKCKFDWCVRGYSHGVYDRGQDSAGILVFEQCHKNVFKENSATHGGDGFFLYAGNETLEKTGEGGCNDNVVTGNDFSHAVANGIEATFSTGNVFKDNRLDDCNYGIWAGYSRKSVFEGNLIRGCTYAGIAIEHGSENVIEGNLIADCRQGVRLWWDEEKGDKKFMESVYGKRNRTDSADTEVKGNLIRGGENGLYVRDSARIRFVSNWVEGTAGDAVVQEGECPDVEVLPAQSPPELAIAMPQDPPNEVRGRRFIIVDEWGPYDFASPRLHPAPVSGGRSKVYMLLGAQEPLMVNGVKGDVDVALRRGRDMVPLVEVVAKPKAGYVPFSFTLESGGVPLKAAGSLLVAEWTVRFWAWRFNPRDDAAAFKFLLDTEPLVTRKVPALDFRWQGEGPAGVGLDRFVTVAETTLVLPAGKYEIGTFSDDGIRVYANGVLVIDDWTHHGPTEHRKKVRVTVDPETGKVEPLEIRVEHFEIDGVAMLTLRIRPIP